MNRTANYIKNRLSLRTPQADSLRILTELADDLHLEKINGDADILETELDKVKMSYPTCTDFERDFPSLCFALATGVGKTRLAGAFVAYLYKEKGIKNFFILAPNLTIYNKLIKDFSDAPSKKYVFRGLDSMMPGNINIITGDNYRELSGSLLNSSETININVFNISKINAETRGGAVPKIRGMIEYLGEAYFDYLSGLPDLVMLMDESHHYRADRGMKVLNELNPILGLELTATPQIEKGTKTKKFKNVVFEYSLAKAIRDGYVKTPAVATRQNFDPTQYSADALDRLKLEDGIRVHEDTKTALDIYARDTGMPLVKPFILVVAKDTTHAGKLLDTIRGNDFFKGYYADKVIEVHSNQRGAEKDDNIAQLVSLESPENKTEIVIHVNMLKEGWDVTNLYTIVPLRTAASMTLREQTIGRGLRLPYGRKTGEIKVDRLTIIAHDRFQEIVDEANKPGSIIKQENIIILDDVELGKPKEVVTSVSSVQAGFAEREIEIAAIPEPEKREKAERELTGEKILVSVLDQIGKEVKNVKELSTPEIKTLVIKRVKDEINSSPQQTLFVDDMIQDIKTHYDTIVEEYQEKVIEIPRISVVPNENVKYGFRDFDLDTTGLNAQPGVNEIMVHTLQTGAVDFIDASKVKVVKDSVENLIINEVANAPSVDYSDPEQKELLIKLAGQTIAHFRTYLTENDDVLNVVENYKKIIGEYIYTQMKTHFYEELPDFYEPVMDVRAYTKIKDHNFSKYKSDNIFDYRETIEPTREIPRKVFSGFKKACHQLYSFDSKTEKDFAIICEQDRAVVKWLRPALNQFNIYYRHGSKQYSPDFVVQTADTTYMVETKKAMDIETRDVQDKARAAAEYCRHATTYNGTHGGNPWKYVIIPHDAVKVNMDFGTLVERYAYVEEKV